jgi:hypothetical protein
MSTLIKICSVIGLVAIIVMFLVWRVFVRQNIPSSGMWEFLEAVPSQNGQAIVVGRKTIEYLSDSSIRIRVYELDNEKWKMQHYGDYTIKGSNLVSARGEIVAIIEADKEMLIVRDAHGDASESYNRVNGMLR